MSKIIRVESLKGEQKKKIAIVPKSNRSDYYTIDYPVDEVYSTNQIDLKKLFKDDLEDFDKFSPWYSIEFDISTDDNIYGVSGYNRNISLHNRKKVVMTPQFSLPAGLYVVTDSISSLTGVSAAALYQFNFYTSSKEIRWFKLGLGFIGLNAINFVNSSEEGESVTPDLGLIGLVTVNGFKKYFDDPDQTVNLAIHLGGGYLINAKKWFFMIGPAIEFKIGK